MDISRINGSINDLHENGLLRLLVPVGGRATPPADISSPNYFVIFLPLSEFIGRVPLGRRNAASVLSALLPSIAVGNLFFPSRLSDHSARLDTDGALRLRGGFTAEMGPFSRATGRRLRAAFRRLGAIALPGSFAVAAPGSDAHYAATLPMRAEPGPLQTSRFGALTGTPDLYVVDGSVLSSLPTKSHTLTIMANAERIGSHVARTL
jgi:GMC oxidoreductase